MTLNPILTPHTCGRYAQKQTFYIYLTSRSQVYHFMAIFYINCDYTVFKSLFSLSQQSKVNIHYKILNLGDWIPSFFVFGSHTQVISLLSTLGKWIHQVSRRSMFRPRSFWIEIQYRQPDRRWKFNKTIIPLEFVGYETDYNQVFVYYVVPEARYGNNC